MENHSNQCTRIDLFFLKFNTALSEFSDLSSDLLCIPEMVSLRGYCQIGCLKLEHWWENRETRVISWCFFYTIFFLCFYHVWLSRSTHIQTKLISSRDHCLKKYTLQFTRSILKFSSISDQNNKKNRSKKAINCEYIEQIECTRLYDIGFMSVCLCALV